MDGKFGIMCETLLADIGNTHFHIYNGTSVEHLSYEDAIKKYSSSYMQYISVKSQLEKSIEKIPSWENVSSHVTIEGEYETMGVDRKALCLSHTEGVFIDAGSAITVDIMEQGKYMGGFILPGLKAYGDCYKSISPVLDVVLNKELSLDSLPCTTKDGISYGIIASIKALIDKHSDGRTCYFTGGDGEFLASFFEGASYDEMLVFNGMQQAIKNKG